MLRYINAVVLAGGKSERMGFCKSNVTFKKNKILSYGINIILDIGFFFVFISGFHREFLYRSDVMLSSGPYSGIFTYKNNVFKNACIFFFTIDMPFIDKSIFFSLILKINKKYSIFYFFKNFPFVMGNTNMSNLLIFKFMELNKISSKSIKKIIKLSLHKNKKKKLSENNFLNLNTLFDLLIYKNI